MMRIERRLFLAAAMLILMPSGLAACSDSGPVQTSFPPLTYSYLPPITLKVASVDVRDDYVPDPDTAKLIAEAPEAPATVLARMGRDRLVANGSPGAATFVIKQASLDEAGGQLVGNMTVELNVRTPDGQRVGYAQASVSRSVAAPSSDSGAAMRAALYDLTKSMMSDMNVQFQYQVQKSLSDWLAYAPSAGVAGSPTAAPPNSGLGGISAQPLPAPSQ